MPKICTTTLVILFSLISVLFLGFHDVGHAKENVDRRSQCTDSQYQEIMNTNFPGGKIHIKCKLILNENDVILANVLFEGSESSGAVLDCKGATINVARGKTRLSKTGIIVRSKQRSDGTWDAPEGVLVRNCVVKGFMRVYGLDENANGANMKMSSRFTDHTKFAQAAAPKRTTFDNLTIVAPHGIALYVGPGAMWTKLQNSYVRGSSSSTAIYLDAESGRSTIENNVFDIKTESREMIAIDGSTRNKIVRNVFNNPVNGGILIYRNCGEGGVIRHQKPNFNVISENDFVYKKEKIRRPAVWLNSRRGKQRYCFFDPRYPFGSSENPLDFANDNTISLNRIIGAGLDLIRSNDGINEIYGNIAE